MMPGESLVVLLRQTYSLLGGIWDAPNKEERQKLIKDARKRVGEALEIVTFGQEKDNKPLHESMSYEQMYDTIKPNFKITTFKEYKASGRPRTFTEMFDGENQFPLREGTYNDIYGTQLEEDFCPDCVSPKDAMGAEGDGTEAGILDQDVLTEAELDRMDRFVVHLVESENLDEGLGSWLSQKYHNWRQKANTKKAANATSDMDKKYYADKAAQHGAAYQGSVNKYIRNQQPYNPNGMMTGAYGNSYYNNPMAGGMVSQAAATGEEIANQAAAKTGGKPDAGAGNTPGISDEQKAQIIAEYEANKKKEGGETGEIAGAGASKFDDNEVENAGGDAGAGAESKTLEEKPGRDFMGRTNTNANNRQLEAEVYEKAGPVTKKIIDGIKNLMAGKLSESIKLEEDYNINKSGASNQLTAGLYAFKRGPSLETLKQLEQSLEALLKKGPGKQSEMLISQLLEVIKSPKLKAELSGENEKQSFETTQPELPFEGTQQKESLIRTFEGIFNKSLRS